MQFKKLATAHMINICGTQVSLIAIPWMFQNGGLWGPSLLLFVRLLPDVLVAPFASQKAFRKWPPQKIISYSLLFQFVLGLAIWFGAWNQMSLGTIATLMFLQACVRYLVIGARFQLVAEQFHSQQEVTKATSTLQLLQQVGTFAGPAIGYAFLRILHVSEPHLFLVDALSFLISAILMVDYQKQTVSAKMPKKSDLDFKKTFSFLMEQKKLLWVLASGICFNLVFFGFMQVIFPGRILKGMHLDASFYSSLLSLQGIGAFIAGILCRHYLNRIDPKKSFPVSLASLIVCFALLIRFPEVHLIQFLYLIMGGLTTIVMINLATIWQTHIPKAAIGSYMASINAVIVVAVLSSYLLSPLIYDWSITAYTFYAGISLCTALVSAGLVFLPQLKYET